TAARECDPRSVGGPRRPPVINSIRESLDRGPVRIGRRDPSGRRVHVRDPRSAGRPRDLPVVGSAEVENLPESTPVGLYLPHAGIRTLAFAGHLEPDRTVGGGRFRRVDRLPTL